MTLHVVKNTVIVCNDVYDDMGRLVTAGNPCYAMSSPTWADRSLCLDSMSFDVVNDMPISSTTSIRALSTLLTTCLWNLGSTESGSRVVQSRQRHGHVDVEVIRGPNEVVDDMHISLTTSCPTDRHRQQNTPLSMTTSITSPTTSTNDIES